MYASTPKDAIIASLSTSKHGLTAKLETIRFIKERTLPHRQLHFITFEDEEGMPMHFIFHVDEVNNGKWRINGGYGGSVGRGPKLPSPRAYIGGISDSTDQFHGGGYVGYDEYTTDQLHSNSHVAYNEYTLARVQLVSANSIVLEDTVEHGVVLFLDDRFIQFPLEARLYDTQGVLLNTHPVLPG